MSGRARFQRRFAAALFEPQAACDPLVRALAAQPAFAVYRNTVMRGCVDALEANFPTVVQLVGTEWFRSAATGWVAHNLPADGRLMTYGDPGAGHGGGDGAGFGAWLQALPTAADLPYLAGVAALDSAWRASHLAADAPPLEAHALAHLPPGALAALALQPHPAARWHWWDELPVAALWTRSRAGHALDGLAWQGGGLLLTRPADTVQWQPLPLAGCVLLARCAAGDPLGTAATEAMHHDPSADLPALLAHLLQAGALTATNLANPPANPLANPLANHPAGHAGTHSKDDTP